MYNSVISKEYNKLIRFLKKKSSHSCCVSNSVSLENATSAVQILDERREVILVVL